MKPLLIGGNACAPHEMGDFGSSGPRQHLGRQQSLDLLQGFIGSVRKDQTQCPQSHQQERHKSQHQEERKTRRQKTAIVFAEAVKYIHREPDDKDALETLE